MVDRTTKKTLSLKHAVSMRDFEGAQNLAEILRTIHGANPNRAQRRAVMGNKIVECRNVREADGKIGLHFAAYIPDDPVALIAHDGPDLQLLNPPAGTDFLDGELMALVSGNDVVICKAGLHENAISIYVAGMAPSAGYEPQDVRFTLFNRTDVDALALIEREGVAEVRFNGVAGQAAIDLVAEGRDTSLTERVIGGLAESFKAIVGMEAARPAQAEHLKVEVFLKFDKRSGNEVDQREIRQIAALALDAEDDEGFEIETLSGRKVRARDVLLSKAVTVTRFGKSIAFDEVWSELVTYYGELGGQRGG